VLTLPVMVMKLSEYDRVHGTDPLPFIVGAIIADGGAMFKSGLAGVVLPERSLARDRPERGKAADEPRNFSLGALISL